MTRIEKEAKKEFLKLSKKEQKKRNAQNRIPVARPGFVFKSSAKKRREQKTKWTEMD